MSTDLWNRVFFAGLYSLLFTWMVFSRCDGEAYGTLEPEGPPRFRPLIAASLLPTVILTVPVTTWILAGPGAAYRMVLSWCFAIFPHICLYYAALSAVMPFLRDHISARACGILWLLPNYLYLTQMSFMELTRPLLTLHAPLWLVAALLGIWLLGFLAVFVWHIAEHLRFRKALLENAVPVTDPAILGLFQEELRDLAVRGPRPRVVMTDAAATPLAIGLFRRRMRIVLPRRDYAPEELRLIFRHELIHISREDSCSKFFMVFCTAMCWFNPLMHRAMEKSAEDFELSCDETVLLGAGDAVRRRYAELLLGTAGDDRGFSTCLSASASALRYRLRATVQPKRRPTGALLVGLAFFLLCITCGYVSLAYGDGTGADTVFRGQEPAEFTLNRVTLSDGDSQSEIPIADGAALTRYLTELPTQEIIGNYSFSGAAPTLTVWYGGPSGAVTVELQTDCLHVRHWADEKDFWETYHLPESVDWNAVNQWSARSA